MTKITQMSIEGSITWIKITGIDHETKYDFNSNVYGINYDLIINAHGIKLDENDIEMIAIRNALRGVWP